jgi:hypothetical protein
MLCTSPVKCLRTVVGSKLAGDASENHSRNEDALLACSCWDCVFPTWGLGGDTPQTLPSVRAHIWHVRATSGALSTARCLGKIAWMQAVTKLSTKPEAGVIAEQFCAA